MVLYPELPRSNMHYVIRGPRPFRESSPSLRARVRVVEKTKNTFRDSALRVGVLPWGRWGAPRTWVASVRGLVGSMEPTTDERALIPAGPETRYVYTQEKLLRSGASESRRKGEE